MWEGGRKMVVMRADRCRLDVYFPCPVFLRHETASSSSLAGHVWDAVGGRDRRCRWCGSSKRVLLPSPVAPPFLPSLLPPPSRLPLSQSSRCLSSMAASGHLPLSSGLWLARRDAHRGGRDVARHVRLAPAGTALAPPPPPTHLPRLFLPRPHSRLKVGRTSHPDWAGATQNRREMQGRRG